LGEISKDAANLDTHKDRRLPSPTIPLILAKHKKEALPFGKASYRITFIIPI